MSDLALGAEFPDASQEAWLALVEKALKGADFDKALASTTYDGIRIAPLYTKADAADEPAPPGSAPFTRGAEGRTGDAPPWHICQSFSHPDPVAANAEILRDLRRGVTALALEIAGSGNNGNGIAVATGDDLANLLDGVLLDLAPVHFRPGHSATATAALYLAYLDGTDFDRHAVRGNLGLDPIGSLAADGASVQSAGRALRHMADISAATACAYPLLRAALVDTTAYHSAGASEAQEIAAALATGIAYLRAMDAAGAGPGEAVGRIGFSMAADADFFATIAKLRAARTLWAEATSACGIPGAAMELRIETADRMMAARDAWVNMLRTTVACFAAGVAGAQSVTVHPYTAALGLPDRFARRIARNTQIILQEESSLGRVLDPAGGSWYVEAFTAAIAEKAWSLFREIESEGGIVESLKSGALQSRIAAVARTRACDIARREAPLTGISTFPNLDEEEVGVAGVDLDSAHAASAERQSAFLAWRAQAPDLSGLPQAGGGALTDALKDAAKAGAAVAEIQAATGDGGDRVPALPSRRLGADFERLRSASDRYLAAGGKRPQIFAASLGPLSAFTARATFAQNFFAAGGIETRTNPGFGTPGEAAAAYRGSGAELAVICSSDALYAEHAEATAKALREAGARHVYLAGAPGDRREALEAAGVGTFIHSGCNVLDILERAWIYFGGPDA